MKILFSITCILISYTAIGQEVETVYNELLQFLMLLLLGIYTNGGEVMMDISLEILKSQFYYRIQQTQIILCSFSGAQIGW